MFLIIETLYIFTDTFFGTADRLVPGFHNRFHGLLTAESLRHEVYQLQHHRQLSQRGKMFRRRELRTVFIPCGHRTVIVALQKLINGNDRLVHIQYVCMVVIEILIGKIKQHNFLPLLKLYIYKPILSLRIHIPERRFRQYH